MSSYFSTLSGSLLEIWSDILDMADQLHTGSIEFIVTRENKRPIGLEVHLQCLLAEQKETQYQKLARDIVETRKERLKKRK
ncbi:hypothetical protein ES705_23263 [subsurface metagenome]